MYKDMASTVTKRALGSRSGSFSMRLRKCFVFLMCDGRLLFRASMKWLMQAVRRSAGPSQPKT